jgi:hypothetical protein
MVNQIFESRQNCDFRRKKHPQQDIHEKIPVSLSSRVLIASSIEELLILLLFFVRFFICVVDLPCFHQTRLNTLNNLELSYTYRYNCKWKIQRVLHLIHGQLYLI